MERQLAPSAMGTGPGANANISCILSATPDREVQFDLCMGWPCDMEEQDLLHTFLRPEPMSLHGQLYQHPCNCVFQSSVQPAAAPQDPVVPFAILKCFSQLQVACSPLTAKLTACQPLTTDRLQRAVADLGR